MAKLVIIKQPSHAPGCAATLRKMLFATFIAVLVLTATALKSIVMAQQPPITSDTAKATSKLFEAVQNNNISGVRTAIAIGADATATGGWGMTATDLAVENGYFDIAHFLLSVRNMRKSESNAAPVSQLNEFPPTTPVTKTTPPVKGRVTMPKRQVRAEMEKAPTPWPADKPNPFDPNVGAAKDRLPIIGKIEEATRRPAAPLKTISGFPTTTRLPTVPMTESVSANAPYAKNHANATGTSVTNPEQPSSFGRMIDSVIPDWIKGNNGTDTTPAADLTHVTEQAQVVPPAVAAPPVAPPVVVPAPPAPAPSAPPASTHASDNIKSKPRLKPSRMRQPEISVAEKDKPVKQSVLSQAVKTVSDKKNDSIFDRLSNFLLSGRYNARSGKAKAVTRVVSKIPPPPTRRRKPTKPVKTTSLPTNYLSGVELSIGKSAKLGQPLTADKMSLIKRLRPPITMADCIKKKQGALAFCIEPVDWPKKIKSYFMVDSIIYQGAKTVVRYDNGIATFFHTLFPSPSFKVVTSYYQRVLGPPSNIWKRSIAPLAAPRRENPTYVWKSVDPVTKQITTLEIRKFDDARGSFPDTANGVIMLYGDSSLPIFPQLSTVETMLINSNIRAK